MDRLFVSAKTGEGLGQLRQLLSTKATGLNPLIQQDDFMSVEFPAQLTSDAD
jgi:hypothetical protein